MANGMLVRVHSTSWVRRSILTVWPSHGSPGATVCTL